MYQENEINILLIEDEEYDVRRVKNTLSPFSDRILIRDVVSNGRDAIARLESGRNRYDVVIMDYQIAGGLSGESLIRGLKKLDPVIQIIVITKMTINVTDFEFASRLMEAGAIWYCTKYPGDIEDYIYQPTDFILSIFNAYEKKKLEQTRLQSERNLSNSIEAILSTRQIVGQSAKIHELRQQIRQCAETETIVLLQGASGTGKELVAANIHYLSARRFEKFVPINCGSLPDHLIESELFGFEKGAFTGAEKQKPGFFEIGNKGTVFLDEITELPLASQAKLLRVLQEGEIDKIGRTGPVTVDVRVIAATNKGLEEAVTQGRFRRDLYYRLNVVSLNLPLLNERRSDIPILVNHFLDHFSSKMNREKPVLTDETMAILSKHNWDGNVRELQNLVQRLLFGGAAKITPEIVNKALGSALVAKNDLFSWSPDAILPLREVEKQLRVAYFSFVRQYSESDAHAARQLGLAPSNYHRMCKELGLK